MPVDNSTVNRNFELVLSIAIRLWSPRIEGCKLTMSKPPFPIPAYVTPENRTEFALRLAALYLSMDGSMSELSTALGFSRSNLHVALKSKGGVNAQTCIKIEELLGRENFPREFFRPDIFIPE